MGWLGWTEAEALNTDVNSIMIAMEGKIEMLYPESKKKTVSSDRFKAFVKTHNEKLKNGRR